MYVYVCLPLMTSLDWSHCICTLTLALIMIGHGRLINAVSVGNHPAVNCVVFTWVFEMPCSVHCAEN